LAYCLEENTIRGRESKRLMLRREDLLMGRETERRPIYSIIHFILGERAFDRGVEERRKRRGGRRGLCVERKTDDKWGGVAVYTFLWDRVVDT